MPPNKIVLLDADVSGHRSVIDLCQSGRVAAYPIRSLSEFEAVTWALVRKQIEADLVVVDTVTTQGARTVQDVVLPQDKAMQVGIANKLADITPSQREWGQSASGLLHFLRPLIELEIPSIMVAHERRHEDPMSGQIKYVPNVQGRVLDYLVGNADWIVRMTTTIQPYQLADGTVAPPGTRQLLLEPTIDSAAGGRCYPPPPAFLLNPTLDAFAAAVGGLPHFTLLYGTFKVGKTTFACGADRTTKG